jgi:hypothetical protein
MAQMGQAYAESKGLEIREDMDLGDPAFQEYLRFFRQINRGLRFVHNLTDSADWHYAGGEAALGDAATPVCWYRPEGSQTYRVVYADLSIRDVTPAELAPFRNDSDRQESVR